MQPSKLQSLILQKSVFKIAIELVDDRPEPAVAIITCRWVRIEISQSDQPNKLNSRSFQSGCRSIVFGLSLITNGSISP